MSDGAGEGANLVGAPSPSPPRSCAFCGAGLEGRRSDARYCSTACRVEAWRLRRLLEGRPVGRYATAADRMAAYGRPRRRSRSQTPRDPVDSGVDNAKRPGGALTPPARPTEVLLHEHQGP